MTRSRALPVFSVCLLSAAAAIWFNEHSNPPLADATASPGLLELVASLAALARPATSLGEMLIAAHRVAIGAAAALTALATWRFTQSWISAAAIGVIAAASSWMLPRLAPTDAAALLAAAATWCAVAGRGGYGVVAGLIAASAIAPSLTVPSAMLCWWVGRRRAGDWGGAGLACLSIAVTAAVMLALPSFPAQSPSLVTFREMLPGAFSAHRAIEVAAFAVSGVGPLTAALAALGVFSVFAGGRAGSALLASDGGRRNAVFTLVWPAAISLATMWSDASPARTIAPLVVGLWLLTGLGLTAAMRASRPGWRRVTVAGAVVAVLLAVALTPRLSTRPSVGDAVVPMGHGTLTRTAFQSVLYQLPSGSGIVNEDAVTDLLLRSLSGSLRRARLEFTLIERTAESVDLARHGRRVFALPRAQRELQQRGVQLADGLAPAVTGIAEVVTVLPCDVTSATWQTSGAAIGATSLAIVAESEAVRGPIVLYTGGPTAIEVTTIGWPSLAQRGFIHRGYDPPLRGQPTLAQDRSTDAAPLQHPAVVAPHVSRTELWRVPGAPLALTVSLSTPPSDALVAQFAQATGHVQLCRVFPFDVQALSVGPDTGRTARSVPPRRTDSAQAAAGSRRP